MNAEDSNANPLFGSADRLELLRKAANILVIDDEDVNLRLITAMLPFPTRCCSSRRC